MRSAEGAPATAGLRRFVPRGRVARLVGAVLVALIVAGCILQVALAIRDTGNYGADVGKVPDWCVPAGTARALGLGATARCPQP